MKQDDKKNEVIKNENNDKNTPIKTWIEDTKEDMEDYIEEQGVYLRL